MIDAFPICSGPILPRATNARHWTSAGFEENPQSIQYSGRRIKEWSMLNELESYYHCARYAIPWKNRPFPIILFTT